MKSIWILTLFTLTFISQGQVLVLNEVYKVWKGFQESSKVKSFGVGETSKFLKLTFGESFNKGDHIHKVKIVSSKLEGNKLIVIVEFPEIVLDISEVSVKDNVSYDVISRSTKLQVETNKTYEVEFYGIHKIQNSDGKTFKENKPVRFGNFKLLSTENWLAHLKKKLEVEDSSPAEFKTFLESEVPSFKFKSASYEELGAALKKIFKENSYDLIFMPGTENPENIKTFNISYEKTSVLELIQRVSSLKNLKYKIAEKSVIIATEDAFKRSKAISNKNGLDLPGLKVDVKRNQVILDAKVCLSSGILEYLMCLPNSFQHESIFMTKVKPELLHMGLLLIQAEQMPYKGRSEIVKKLNGNKARLKIEVEWSNEGKRIKTDLNNLLIDRLVKEKKSYAQDSWFFVGSYFTERNIYAANLHQSVISLQQHPASVIHYGKVSEDPYHSKRGGFEINEKLCPPMDTEVKLIFTVHE